MSALRRLMFRATVAATVAVLAVLAIAYWLLTRSLAQLDGELGRLPLKATVSIERDERGVPTITAKNRVDLAFATGFVHAQDRFFQMDLMRRQAAGELAALAGAAALPLDRENRMHRFRYRARAVVAAATTREMAVLEAYTAGVNAGLDRLKAKPFEYFVLNAEPERWRDEDSILVAMAMFMELNDEKARRDIQRGLVHRVLPAAVFEWLYPPGTDWDAPLVGAAAQVADIPGPELLDLRSVESVAGTVNNDALETKIPGSNNWAVSGRLSDSGAAIVASDMHLGIRVPNTFYRARLKVTAEPIKDLNGLTLPGTPVLVSGSNGHIAWAFTNSYGDWSDAVIVRAGSAPGQYLTPDGDREFTQYRETIQVKGGRAEERLVKETIWGPIVDESDYPVSPLAISWIAHHARAINLRHLELETATSVAAALDIANTIGMPPQNFVCGDVDGNIGWTIAGSIPRRAGYDPFVPADWSQQQGWAGWLAPQEYPRIVNPADGRLWTANARVVDSDALKLLGDGGYDLGARAKQIRDGLRAKDRFSPIDMLSIQIDDRALFLERWRTLLLNVLDQAATAEHDDRRDYRSIVENWIPRARANSAGYRLVRAFRMGVRQAVFDMLVTPVRREFGADTELRISNQFEGPLWALLQDEPAHLLTADYASWRDLLLGVVDDNVEYFSQNFSGTLRNRTWGERNIAQIRHPLSPALPFLSYWLDMPREPLDGDSHMPRAQGPAFGASERFALAPGDEERGYLHMPTGQSGHPLSAFYNRGHDDWVQGRATGFLPGARAHRLTLTPH